MTSYYVSHSQDGTSWEEISTLFEANEDSYAKKTNRLPDNIVARYIRLRPNSWNTRIAMRFDVTGCALQGRTLVYTLNVKIMSSLLQLGYTVQQIYKSWMQKEGYIFFCYNVCTVKNIDTVFFYMSYRFREIRDVIFTCP